MIPSDPPCSATLPWADGELSDEELECVAGGVSRIPVAPLPVPAR
jgi:hypothetical protein